MFSGKHPELGCVKELQPCSMGFKCELQVTTAYPMRAISDFKEKETIVLFDDDDETANGLHLWCNVNDMAERKSMMKYCRSLAFARPILLHGQGLFVPDLIGMPMLM